MIISLNLGSPNYAVQTMLVYDLLATTFQILCRPQTTLHGTSKYVALRLHSAGGKTCSTAVPRKFTKIIDTS